MKVVSFFSPVTGNGKTEFAVNFAYTMAKEHGLKVLLLEVDPYSPKLYNVYLRENTFILPEEWSNNYIFEGKNFDQIKDHSQVFIKPVESKDLDLYFFPVNPEFDPFRHAGEYAFGIDQIFLARPWKIINQLENLDFDILVLILPSRFSLLSSSFFLVSSTIIIIAGFDSIASINIDIFNESIFTGIRVGLVISNAHLPLTYDDLVEQQISVEKTCFLPVLMTIPRIKAPVVPGIKFRITSDTGIEQLFSKLTGKLKHFIYDKQPQQLRTNISKPLSLMIVLSSGIPVFFYIFEEKRAAAWQKQTDRLLLGGSMVGIQAVIAKISGTDDPVKVIDSGQIKLMIEKAQVSDDRFVYGILRTTAVDNELRDNLKAFTELFVEMYSSKLMKRLINKGDFKGAYRILGETFFADKPQMIHDELSKKIEEFASKKQLPVSREVFRLFVHEQLINDIPDRNLMLAEFISKHNDRHQVLISHGIIPTQSEKEELERNLGARLCRCVLIKRELAPLDAITLLQLPTDEMKEIATLIIEKETIALPDICRILDINESRALSGITGLIESNHIRRVDGKANIFTIES